MLDALFQQGYRNIRDASFVREHLIPTALSEDRWNIVVYEAHRGTEFLMRGMVCLLGSKPPEHHNLSGHVTHLLRCLPGEKDSKMPFTIGAYVEEGKGYGVLIRENAPSNVEVWRLDNGVLTNLGRGPEIELPVEGPTNLRLEVDPPVIRVYLNGTCLAADTDCTHIGPFTTIDRSFVRQPKSEAVRRLRKLGKQLTKKRNPALYGEQQYTKNDAMHAISYMNKSFGISAAFFSID